MSTHSIRLKPFQAKAVDEAVDRKSLLLKGGTGCGKTVTALFIALQSVLPGIGTGGKRVLVVSPSMGGSLLHQWAAEASKVGIPPEAVCIFRGEGRLRRLAEWHNSDVQTPLMLCITTPDTICQEYKLRGPEEAQLFNIHWHIILSDEAHMWRNGSSRGDLVEVNLDRKRYTAMDCLVEMHKPKLVLITATPLRNHPMDVYSLVRWLDIPGCTKRAWLKRNEDTAGWRYQKRLVAEATVSIDMPPPPETLVEILKHELSPEELLLMETHHCALSGQASELLYYAGVYARAPHPANKEKLDIAKVMFQAALTAVRRGAMHPELYTRKSTTKIDGKVVPVPLPVESILQRWPIDKCSRFKCILQQLQKHSHQKVLVMCYWKEAIVLLKHYLQLHCPDREVILHHGGMATQQAMALFRSTSSSAVMLATRGSIGEGVSMDWVTVTIMADQALSSAEDNQARGRMKRPLAQVGVTEWRAIYTQQFVSEKPDVEEWLVKLQEVKKKSSEDIWKVGATKAEEVRPAAGRVEGPVRILKSLLSWIVPVPKPKKRKRDTNEE